MLLGKKVVVNSNQIQPKHAAFFNSLNTTSGYTSTSLEVFHMLEGEGRMTIGGVEHVLSPGDTIVCKPPEDHSARNEGSTTWRYIVFKTNVTEDDSYWLDQ